MRNRGGRGVRSPLDSLRKSRLQRGRRIIRTGRWPVTFSPHRLGQERCDSYLRLGEDGRGFAFVFNSNEKKAQAVIPLNGAVGLEAAQSYRVEHVFPESSEEIPARTDARGEARFTLPPRSVALLSIQPKP